MAEQETKDKEADQDVLHTSTDDNTTASKPKNTGIAKVFGTIWKTTRTEGADGDQELHMSRTFRELIIYMVFLFLVCFIAFGSVSVHMYLYTKVMIQLFVGTPDKATDRSFSDIVATKHFWEYLRGSFLTAMYWDKWYNSALPPNHEKGNIYYENKILGVPRIRQVRVKNDSCIVNEEFRAFVKDCFSDYSISKEDTTPFGYYRKYPNNTEWFYRTGEETQEFPYWGKIHQYGAGGYIKDLTFSREETEDIITNLQGLNWIDRGSRAVLISFTVYNANINLFCIVMLTVEFPATGGAIPGWTFTTLKLIRYVTAFDKIIFGFEIVYCIFILYYIIEELMEISVNGCKYFQDGWNSLDALLIILSCLCIGFSFYRSTYMDKTLNEMLQEPNAHASKFQYLAFSEMVYNNVFAITVFTAWLKIFKYISFNKTMTQLSTTLSRCAKDLLGFFIMFFIVFLAFTQLGYLLFGTQVDEFSTFMNTFFTLFRIILGDFNFYQLEQANRILGPIYFIVFVFFVFFVLINMFLAIINDTYSEVKSDMAKQPDQYIMSDFLRQGYNKVWDKYLSHKKAETILNYEAVLSKGVPVPFDEWKDQLQKLGFKAEEIDEVFKRYDTDGDKILDVNEQKNMLQELQQMKLSEQNAEGEEETRFDEEEVAKDDDDLPAIVLQKDEMETVAADDFSVLIRRVDRMETTIRGVVRNIDTVLDQIANMR